MTATPSSPLRLNLGCGNKRLADHIGVDRFPCEGAQLLADIARLPFPDACTESVVLDNVIEHVLDIPALMREVWRVCRPGARVLIVTPHFSSQSSWRDPTHVHHLSFFSMDHFLDPGVQHYVGGGFAVRRRELQFSRNLPGRVGKLIFRCSPNVWEKQFCFVFRGRTLTFELEVLKGPRA
jgi:SAM-dependent methyltransferase